jgi:hypothetical protein
VFASSQLSAIVSYAKAPPPAGGVAHELPEAGAVGTLHVADAATGACLAVLGGAAARGGRGGSSGVGAGGGAGGESPGPSPAPAPRGRARAWDEEEQEGGDADARAALADVSALFVDEGGAAIFTGNHAGVAHRWGPEACGPLGGSGGGGGGGGSGGGSGGGGSTPG